MRRAKAAFLSGCESHPAIIAPAGSNRSSHGGNEVAEASDVKGHFRVPDRGSVNPSPLGDGSGCMEKAFNIIPTRLLKRRIPSPSGRRPGRGGGNQEEVFVESIPSPQPSPGGRGGLIGRMADRSGF